SGWVLPGMMVSSENEERGIRTPGSVTGGSRGSGLLVRRPITGERPRDEVAVEAPVLDERLVRIVAAGDHARNEHARHDGLHRRGIVRGNAGRGIAWHAELVEQLH